MARTRACTLGYAAFGLLADISNALAITSIESGILCRLLRRERMVDQRPLQGKWVIWRPWGRTLPRSCTTYSGDVALGPRQSLQKRGCLVSPRPISNPGQRASSIPDCQRRKVREKIASFSTFLVVGSPFPGLHLDLMTEEQRNRIYSDIKNNEDGTVTSQTSSVPVSQLLHRPPNTLKLNLHVKR